jgi:hypothetical protein
MNPDTSHHGSGGKRDYFHLLLLTTDISMIVFISESRTKPLRGGLGVLDVFLKV